MLSFRNILAFVAFFQLLVLVDSKSSGNIELPDRPWNLAVTVGKSVGMKCKPDNISKISEWTIHRPFNLSKILLWAIRKNNTRVISSHYDFDVDEDGSATLYINLTQLDDAGIYTCTEDKITKQPERYSAQLTVLESDPQCSDNISVTDIRIKEFDYVEFRCTVNYSGHWTPIMQWSKEGIAMNTPFIDLNINISQDVQQLTSILNLEVRADDNDALITCNTLFIKTTENVNRTSAINIPQYVFSWNATLDVLFGPKNVTITPRKDIYRREDVLSCGAVGNPGPSYIWRRAETTIADGPQLALNEAGLEANRLHIIECIADNHIEQSSASIDIIISGNSIIIILTGTICAILLLIMIVIGKEHIKGLIVKRSSLFQQGPANEPDILPNADVIQNGDVSIDDFEPCGHYAVPAEILAVTENSPRQRVEGAIGNRAENEGAVANQLDETRGVKFPVYAHINKAKKQAVPECNICGPGVVTNTPTSKQMSIGFDGTVYAEIRKDGCLNQSEASGSLFQNPMFNKSEYASIDHTTEAPPPP